MIVTNVIRSKVVFTAVIGLTSASSYGGPNSVLAPGGEIDDAVLSVVYDARTGEVAVDVPTQLLVTSVVISSETQDFDWICPADGCGEMTLFRPTFGTILSSFSFGEVAAPGLSQEFLLSDLSVHIGLQDGHPMVDTDLVYIPVPEPSGFLLMMWALLGAALLRRWIGRI